MTITLDQEAIELLEKFEPVVGYHSQRVANELAHKIYSLYIKQKESHEQNS